MSANGRTYRFGPFELDAGNAELRRDGQPVKLAPQPFTVLLMLVERPGALVTRDELRRAVWGDEHHVDFNAGLNFCLAQIRTALDESSSDPGYLITVPRRGYKFVAPVAVQAGRGDTDQRQPSHQTSASPVESGAPVRSTLTRAVAAVLVGLVTVVAVFVLWRPAVLATRPESVSLPAMTAFERGALALDEASPDELRSRITFFKEATRHDPSFARAYAGLAETELMLAEYRGDEPQRAYAMAKASAQRALALTPALPEAHAILGAVLWQFNWDWKSAERHLQTAVDAGDSPMALVWASRYRAAQGRHDDARALSARAVDLAPRSARTQTNLGTLAFYRRDYTAAVAACRRASALVPKFTPADMCLVAVAAETGQLPLAIERTLALAVSRGDEGPPATATFDDLWRSRLSRLERHREACQCDHEALSFALVHARLGDRDQALGWLERAADLHVDGLVYAGVHPAFDVLRGERRFAVVLDRVGVPNP